ncbi:MAG: shikimate kinase [Alphaproteobacteria bacterium]|nr:shikimate kinase [Alphaproteobacteria bacterium]
MIIILNGLSGCGKSSTGKALAKALNYPFIDLDKQIENTFGSSIADIFKNQGENYFRNLEAESLKEVLTSSHENLVLSLGGGVFKNDNNVNLCLQSGLVVWLNMNLDIIAARLKNYKNRPLLQGTTTLKENLEILMKQRYSNYMKSHIKLDFDKNYPISHVVKTIIIEINTYNAGKLYE